MSAQMNVPKLRFPEFSGEWEDKKLGDIATFYNSKRIPLTESDRKSGIYPYYGASGIIDYVEDYIFDGEYILLGEDGANIVMRNSRLVFLAKGKFWVNNHAHIFQAKESNYFLCEALERVNYVNYNTGTAQPKLNAEVVKKIKLRLPILPEQTKIANFLTSLDTKIDQLTKKQTLLKQYKKGVMQKLFSQELRFKADDGSEFSEWEEKKISDVLKIGSGKDYKHLQSGDIPVFGTGGYMTSVNECLYDGESVCIGRKGTIDKPMYFNGKFWTVDTLFYTHSFKQSIPKFIYAIFLQINWKQYSEASGVPSLSKSTIENIQITIPSSIEEQTKIANFLTSLDTKIDFVTQQLDETKQFKKALLQQMFV